MKGVKLNGVENDNPNYLGKQKETEIYFLKDDSLYAFSYPTGSSYQKEFDGILASFRFTK